MQKTVRYYITQSGDQPVVRSALVTVRPTATERPVMPTQPAARPQVGRTRVGRLVRAATRRVQPGR
jgi:hypothetical protein